MNAKLPTDLEIIKAMRRYGGGFASSLAEAASRADSENLRRIKAAFPELWNSYGRTVLAMFKEPNE